MILKEWVKQPSTILGIGVFAASCSAVIVHAITHDQALTALDFGVVFGLIHMAFPDNTAAESSVEKLVKDAVVAAAQQKLALALPLLIQDGMAVVSDIVTKRTTSTTTTTAAVPVATVAVTSVGDQHA